MNNWCFASTVLAIVLACAGAAVVIAVLIRRLTRCEDKLQSIAKEKK